MSKHSKKRPKLGASPISKALLVVTILLVGANLRPALTSVGPMLQLIKGSEDLSPSALGILGAVPLLTFAAVSPLVHLLSKRIGVNESVFIALLILSAGTVIRSLPGSESLLWIGTILLAAGIAICNVLVPAIVKNDFPNHIAVMSGAYSAFMNGFAGLASGLAVPIAAYGGWPLALGIWSGLALVAAALWGARLRGRTAVEVADTDKSVCKNDHSMWSSAVAWYVAAFTALQSMSFYVLITWLPSIEASNGVSASLAGWHLSGYLVIGIAAGLTVGQLMREQNDQRTVASLISASMAVAMLGFIIHPSWAVLWILLAGLSSGAAFVVSLILVSVRVRNASDVGRLAGMAQGVGYLAAAFGPIGAGALFEIFENGTLVLVGVLAIAMVQLVAAQLAGRNRFTHSSNKTEDSLGTRRMPEGS